MSQTRPEKLADKLVEVAAQAQHAEAGVERLHAEWAQTKTSLAGVVEELTDLGDTIETKRKRIAARQGKDNALAAPMPGTPEHRAYLLQQARAAGHPV
jgi:chromosome segregation ATPase